MASSLTYRRLRAAPEDGGIVLQPGAGEWEKLPGQNQTLLGNCDFSIAGQSYQHLRSVARSDLIRLATQHVQAYADVDLPNRSGPIVMSGHQPELFHPGVWAKNFAVHSLAEAVQGTAVHVIVDNDLMRKQEIIVPSGEVSRPRVVAVPFDRFEPPRPFETRRVADSNMMHSFAERVTTHLRPIFDEELTLHKVWPQTLRAVEGGSTIGHAFAQGRHQLELHWGRLSLEVPLSQLCETMPFRRFTADLLLRGERVFRCFNQRLAEYRRVHRTRSAAQPLPDLRRDQGWTEAPFWYWTNENPTRSPLWWCRRGDRLEIGIPGVPVWTFNTTSHSADWEELWNDLAAQGVSIRPRALTNTLFLRLFLSDLFVHGIGGAKYDQITDLLVGDLYPISSPAFTIISKTIWLPVDYATICKGEIAKKKSELRQLYFHPEIFLSSADRGDPQVSSWVQRKRECVTSDPRGKDLALRHDQIQEANANLRGFLLEKREELKCHLSELESRHAASQIWSFREWAFPLFPLAYLRSRLLDLALHPS